jgi:recombination protein RecA
MAKRNRKKQERKKTFEEAEKFLKKEAKLEGVLHETERIKTGIPGLDYIFGGGFPRGRFTEIYGYEESGKTTLSLMVARAVQKQDERVLFWDYEHAMEPSYFKACGIDISKSLFKWEQPACLETGADSLIEFIETGEVGIAIIDSFSSMLPMAELRGDMGDMQVALKARLISRFLCRVIPLLAKNQTDLIAISHMKDPIGPYKRPDSVGGRAPKFYASIRIQTTVKQSVDWSTSGTYVLAKLKKNKTTAKLREAIPLPIGDTGVDVAQHIKECLINYGAVEQKGSWFYLQGKRVAHGETALVEAVKKAPVRYTKALENVWYGNKSKRGRTAIDSEFTEDGSVPDIFEED